MLESGTHSGGAYAPKPLVSEPDRSEQIALYCGDGDMRRRIKGLLPDADLCPFDAPDTFSALLRAGHRLSVVGLRSVRGAHVQWLQHSLGQSLADQSCLVVAPLSLSNLQRVRELDSNVFRVVWDEEADDRLVTELDEVSGDRGWRACPLWSLGRISHTVTAEGCWGRVRAEFLPRDPVEHEQAALGPCVKGPE